MDSNTEILYTEKIEEFVRDDDKIVTIPSLATGLGISMSISQRLLSKYVDDQRKLRPKDLSVTYILTGSLKEKGKAVMIVKEDDLKLKRNLFDKINSEVLFSIQKNKQIDFNVIALTNDVKNEGPLLGSIVSKNCVKRILKTKKFPTPPPSTIKGKSSFFLPKSESASSTETSKETSKTATKPKQNGISNMFTKAGTQNNEREVAKTSKASSSTMIKSKGGLSSFLSKGNLSSDSCVKTGNGIKKEDSNVSENQISELEELMDVDFQELDEEILTDIKKEKKDFKVEEKKSDVKEEKKKNTKKPEDKDKKSKNKRQRDKSAEKTAKKRKRIVERNDSESDDMFENEDVEVIEKSDDEPERVPSPVPSKPLIPKNKIRKAVDKTYMDDEGFIVTKTEYVYESAPEDDEVDSVKTQEKEKPKIEKKNSASSENEVSPKGAKGKKKGKKNNMQNQPTLMNFFKKK